MPASFPGHQRLIAINDSPIYLDEPFLGFPKQEAVPKDFVQGGPRTKIYYIGEKLVKGSFKAPIFINEASGLDPGIKQLLLCAENPLRDMTITTNYVAASSGVTAWNLREDLGGLTDNLGFGKLKRMAFTSCGITELALEVPNEGRATLNVEFVGLVDELEASITPDPVLSGMMRTAVSYAMCDVFLEDPEYQWDASRSFTVKVSNQIEPIIAIPTWLSPTTDQPVALAMGTSHLTAEIKHSVDRGSLEQELSTLPSGGLNAHGLRFDIAGMVIVRFPNCIMSLTDQPIGLGMLERTTRVLAGFDLTELSDSVGSFLEFP